MAKADETTAVAIPRSTLEAALLEHLTEKIFDNPEQRDELIRSLVMEVLGSKEHDYDKMTLIEKYIRRGIGAEVEKIASSWVKSHKKVIEEQVAEALKEGLVRNVVLDMAKHIGERITRGY